MWQLGQGEQKSLSLPFPVGDKHNKNLEIYCYDTVLYRRVWVRVQVRVRVRVWCVHAVCACHSL